MGLTKRGAAATSAPITRKDAATSATAPSAGATKRKPSVADDADAEVPYTYQHRKPALILGSFALALCLVLYCAISIYSIRRDAAAAAIVSARASSVQALRARQVELNANTLHKWELYAEQRGNVTQQLMHLLKLVEDGGAAAPSLCLLGAGNLNDVLLQTLLRPVEGESPPSAIATEAEKTDPAVAFPAVGDWSRGFDSVSLVDLDSASMEAGWERQVSLRGLDPRRQGRVRLFTSDVTASFERMTEWKKERVRFEAERDAGKVPADTVFPALATVDAWIGSLQQRPRAPDGSALVRPRGLPVLDSNGTRVQYDAVASVCLLSQLLDMYMSVVSESHPRFLAGALALREAHLALLLDLARPGGWLLLVTDIVASTTLPELRRTAHADLPALLPAMLASSNFFSGCNPRAIHAKLASHFQADIRPGSLRTLAPWKWRIGGDNDKQFLVYAMLFQKA